MSTVVNKIIFNCLVQYGNVALPEVGTLSVVGSPKKVTFSDKITDSHIPVTDIIADHGGLTAEEAMNIYHDWLQGAQREDGTICVESVGVITPRHFDIDQELQRALNGDELPTATLNEKSGFRLGNILLIVVLILLLALAWMGISRYVLNQKEAKEVVIEEPTVVPFEEQSVEVAVVPEPEVVVPNPPAANKRYNIAVGVFSIKYNARACAKQDPLGIGADNYLIAPFPSGLWVVIAHSTDNLAEAERMRLKYKKMQSDIWVYRRY